MGLMLSMFVENHSKSGMLSRFLLHNMGVRNPLPTDLCDAMPEKLAELTEVLYSMDNQMVEPLWPPLVKSEIPVGHTRLNVPDENYEAIIWTN